MRDGSKAGSVEPKKGEGRGERGERAERVQIARREKSARY